MISLDLQLLKSVDHKKFNSCLNPFVCYSRQRVQYVCLSSVHHNDPKRTEAMLCDKWVYRLRFWPILFVCLASVIRATRSTISLSASAHEFALCVGPSQLCVRSSRKVLETLQWRSIALKRLQMTFKLINFQLGNSNQMQSFVLNTIEMVVSRNSSEVWTWIIRSTLRQFCASPKFHDGWWPLFMPISFDIINKLNSSDNFVHLAWGTSWFEFLAIHQLVWEKV